jgi:hypothetical protein
MGSTDSTFDLSNVRVRSHKDQHDKRILRFIPDAVFDIRRRHHNVIRSQIALIIANVKPAGALENEVNFIGAAVRVTLLFLTGLETIDIGEHPFGLEQIHLLHLVSGESPL